MVEHLGQPISASAITSYADIPSVPTSLKSEGAYHNETNAAIAKTIEFSTPLQIPTGVFSSANRVKLSSIYDPRTKYKIFAAPIDAKSCVEHCFKGIGKSGTICLNKNCKPSQSGELFEVPPGSIMIKRTNNKTFIEPIVNSYELHPNLFDRWLEEECTLSEWVKRFGLVKSTVTLEENPIITQQVMDQELALKN